MINIIRTSSDHQDFIELVKSLDEDLAGRDGADHSFYAQFNTIDRIKHVVLAYENGKPSGCGALKEHGADTMGIKRVYTDPQLRTVCRSRQQSLL